MTEKPRSTWGPSNYEEWEAKQSTGSPDEEPKEITFEEYVIQRLEYLPALEKYLQGLHDKIDKLDRALRSVSSPSVTRDESQPRPRQQPLPRDDMESIEASVEARIRESLPRRLYEKLHFTARDDMIEVKNDYLRKTEDWQEIARVMRGLGGQWISAGRDSRFEIPL